MKYSGLLEVLCFLCLASFLLAAESTVVQSARQIPVAHEVDLLVLGGSTGAVAAACEAAANGAEVMLVTPYPYLGDDRTATLRLGGENDETPEDPLIVALREDEDMPSARFADRVRRLPKHCFTYKIDGKINSDHTETNPPSRLTDNRFGHPATDALQVDGDAMITLDLAEPKDLRRIVLLAYRRSGGKDLFDVERVELEASVDAKTWTQVACPFNSEIIDRESPDGELVAFTASFDEAVSVRYLKLHITKKESVVRMLLAELIVLPEISDENVETFSQDRLPRPMHVKRVLDRALLDAGVSFLMNVFPVSDIHDENATSCGAVIAGRDGRRAILAKRVLDARIRATSLKTAGFVSIGAKPHALDLEKYPLLESVSYEILGRPFVGLDRDTEDGVKSVEYPVVEYTFRLRLPPDADPNDIALRAEIESQIRLATYSPDQAFTADSLSFSCKFKPLAAWRTIGRTLAVEAMKTKKPKIETLSVASNVKPGDDLAGDVREIPVMSNENATKMVFDPKRRLPVLGKYDVAVVGGGTSGAPAGIAAGRYGAKTLVLEHLHDLGGVGTAGAITGYWYGNVTGFTVEVLEGQKRWKIEHKTAWWREKTAEAGTDVWYGVLVVGALIDRGRVRGVLVATPFGLGVVEAEITIDATGNADIAGAAGAGIQSYDTREIAVQGAGLAQRILGASYANNDFTFVDDADTRDVSHAFVYAKGKYPKAFDQAKLIGTRERRRVEGEFSFSVLDQLNYRTYPDSIVYAYSDYDIHGYTIDPYMELNHPYYNFSGDVGAKDRPDRIRSYVPYRSSIPKGLDGIFVVGLATSCHRDALPIVRMQPDLQNQGYAIGRAAAILAKTPGKNVRKLDVRELQRHLVDIGNLKSEVLEHVDNYGNTRDRLPATVESLPEHFHESVPLVMWYPEEARPLVRAAYLRETDFGRKLVYARVAATLGDPVGVPTILEELDKTPGWDKGWNFRGMGQTGAATSPVDRLVMMLGRLKDPRALGTIVKKAALLTPDSEFSHIRAVALALENIGGAEAARSLARLLDLPGMTGYVHDSIAKAEAFDDAAGRANQNQNIARQKSLAEISLARALYRCGDIDGKGEAILREYTKDLRGHFSRHARAVLSAK